jgi:hypothetical protein
MNAITLLTDFGDRDGFVAAMKGVIACLAPGAAIHDAAHGVPPGDVRAAAWALSQYWRLWPEGTIHVAVVDPGVGTERAALLARADGRLLLAPDNGLLALVAAEADRFEAFALRADVRRPDGHSATFHGRDVFACAAGRLAAGHAPDSLCGGPVGLADAAWAGPDRAGAGVLHGEVIHVDRFGNAVTNLRPGDLPAGAWRLAAGRTELARLERTYGDVTPGAPLAYEGSSGRIEIAIRGGSAEKGLDLRRGTPIILRSIS